MSTLLKTVIVNGEHKKGEIYKQNPARRIPGELGCFDELRTVFA